MNDQPSATTGRRLLQILEDEGIVQAPKFSIGRFTVKLQNLVDKVEDAHYQTTSEWDDAILELKRFVGILSDE